MPSFPHKVTKQGISVTIGRVEKDGQNFFRVLYREQGKRKQAWRSSFEDAKRAADDAIETTLTGDASALKLNASDRHAYLRALEFLAPLNIALDHAARDYADIRIMLAGKATPVEVCRDWLKRNAVELPKITVADAVAQLKKQAETDGKSNDRQKQLAAALDAFATAFNQEVHTINAETGCGLSHRAAVQRAHEGQSPGYRRFFQPLVGAARLFAERHGLAGGRPEIHQAEAGRNLHLYRRRNAAADCRCR
jgi:hypothetical protein